MKGYGEKSKLDLLWQLSLNKGKKMKINQKIAGILLGIGVALFGTCSAFAGAYTPYDRSSSVAEEEYRYQRENTQGKTVSERAWQKINGVCYNGSGVAIQNAVTRGIDVSEWQGTINWSKVANSDVDFAFVRVAHGLSHMDTKFAANMSGANSAGVPVGVYVYSTATTVGQAIQEAQLTISKMQGYKVSYPVVFDMEYSDLGNLSGAKIAEIAVAFCTEIKNAGYYPMVYSNADWYNNKLDLSKIQAYDFWLAWYGDHILAPSTSKYRYTIWQATDGDGGGVLNSTKGLIDGIPVYNNVDVNFGFVDYTKVITPRTTALSSYTPTVIQTGWVNGSNGERYYYKDGVKVTGRRYINGKYYRFAQSDGHLYQDVILYSASLKKSCYVNEDGEEVHSTWVTKNNKMYYFGADGYSYAGSRYVNGKFYFFNSRYGYAMTNWKYVTSQKAVYYYNYQGIRVTNCFVTLTEGTQKNTYYFSSNGAAYRGWKTIGGNLYYFYGSNTSKNSVRVENRTIQMGNYLCVFDELGVCTRTLIA